MDTIQDTPEETFGERIRRSWRPGRRSNGHSKAAAAPRGRPFSREADWHTVALVSAGVAVGALLGAGVALLVAPQSGAHTRLALSRQLRRHRPWHTSPWEQLGEELSKAARRRNNRIKSAHQDEDLYL
jgi:hypothetical protein